MQGVYIRLQHGSVRPGGDFVCHVGGIQGVVTPSIKPRSVHYKSEAQESQRTRVPDKFPTKKVNSNNNFKDPFDPDNDFRLSDPYGRVEDVMTSWSLKTTTPDVMLKDVIASFEKVSGVPVLDGSGIVVGVLTRKDIKKALKKSTSCLGDPVSQHMSDKPVTVRPHAHIAEAAGLMLAYKVHRIPVVDSTGKLVGLISRTDVFRPLLEPHDNKHVLYRMASTDSSKSVELDEIWDYQKVLEDAEKSEEIQDLAQGKWEVKYLYDGDCEMCLALKKTLEGHDNGRGLIKFVNIADPEYNPESHGGIEFEEAMDSIHVIRPDGTILKGTDALSELYSTVGMAWVQTAANLPVIGALMDSAYDVVSKLRLPISKQLKTNLTAVKRYHESEKGNEHCSATEECIAEEW
eukprot:TRINITY_DN5046_c0_g1_i4.p1 TRINITY_DN5046_c0_g1~~TRINITY_DN5046_c0_g1_i4.p1  ORF type:complete len:404 (+),score=58.87 TRINITY_DN5046_c0_g1_i4:2777-3988(+)